jgi:hypothetical protein
MADLLLPILNQYTNFVRASDGIPEINSLTYMPFESGYSAPPADVRFALVLIEPRLLDATGNAALRPQLLRCLHRFKGDLRAEGLYTRFLLANLYRGPAHKDGSIVLALRRFLGDVKAVFSRFEGVILVGNFPEATLVRRVSWSPGFLSPRQLAIGTELISSRAEIVLADLTGNWESLYRQTEFDAEDINARPDAATIARGWFDGESVRTCEFTSTDFTLRRSGLFKDAFYLDDARYSILENRSTPSPFLRLQLLQAERNNEVDMADRSLVNILARPDISVSRINALHVAVNPNPSLHGSDGRTFLDAAGKPQTVAAASAMFSEGSQWLSLFTFRDFDLERRLLVDYFNRNHRFRVGAFSHLPFRAAVVSGTTDFSPDWYEPLVNAAASDFQPCVKVPNADLLQYVEFHKTPAVLKYIMAHSDARFSEFRGGYSAAALTTAVGGAPPRWVYRSGQHTPSFENMGGGADIFTHRALWLNDTLRSAGASLMIHGGCNVNSVDETQTDIYSTTRYAHWNNAEGILFYTNCVALFSRAKGFNDAPNGFADGYRLSDRANFGSCWRTYFNAQGNDAGLSTYNIQRKRAYFWSINGDWSLRLRNRNGLGILALAGQLGSVEVHPNGAWIDGWNYDATVNRIRGIGDIDEDGRDEFVVTSNWGMGILKHDGVHFRALLTAPRDTWFGGWRYDATINSGRDQIKDVKNFTGGSRSEIMVWSSWGLATLEFNGLSLSTSRIHQNGTRIGGWLVGTSQDVYCGSGQFDSDSRNDMVVTSPWGVGILSLQSSAEIFMAPNGTRFGGWLFNSGDNRIRLIADFDGDGRDEILITSPWGIGILKLSGSTLTSVAMHPNGENLGGFVVRNTSNFALADNLKGGAVRQILVADAAGLHVLRLAGNRLERIAFTAQGVRVGGWVVDTSHDRLQRAGDMNADGSAEFVIRSPWGIGIMGLDAGNAFRCHSLFGYGAGLNDWVLWGGDEVVGAGALTGTAGRRELLITRT